MSVLGVLAHEQRCLTRKCLLSAPTGTPREKAPPTRHMPMPKVDESVIFGMINAAADGKHAQVSMWLRGTVTI